jgi:hypothetical protein
MSNGLEKLIKKVGKQVAKRSEGRTTVAGPRLFFKVLPTDVT